jgi:hypothetical protein
VIFLEDKFRELDGKMNSTVLTNLDFSEKRKREVLRNIKNMEREKTKKRGILKPILSTVFTGVLCIGIVFFT